jgi:outer membrane murein-binding lipoprotein Lpp
MSDARDRSTAGPETQDGEQAGGQEETPDTSDEAVPELIETVQRLEARVATLEAETDRLRATVEAVTQDTERHSEELQEAFQTLTPMRKLLIGDGHDTAPLVVMKQLREQHGPVNQQLADLTHRLSQRDTEVREQIKREVGVLRAEQNAKFHRIAAETGVELDAADGDIITRVRNDGIEAVCATPRKRDRRAAYVLQHIEEWGTKEQLRAGPAYRLPRPRVKRVLNATDAVTVTMTSKTVGDVFDAIEALAARSPRVVQRRKHDGVDNLYVGFPETGD